MIGNALQYSPEGSTISVQIVGETDYVSVSVHNIGEAISPEEQRSIFKPLTRGTDIGSNERSTNLGLGLFITHKIVTAHNGKISVYSTPNSGTTFSVMLPRG